MTVLVVGAGPTGLAMACELARRNVPVRIVDKAPEYFRGSRGKGLQPRTLEVFDDLGVVDEAFAWGIEGIRFRNYRPGQPPVDTDPRVDQVRTPAVPYPKSVVIPQWRTERILRDRLATFGTHVELGTELVGFEQSADGVTVTLTGPAGTERVVVDYLIGCDGGHSAVRKALGIEFAGETADTAAMIIADLEVAGLPDDRWYMWMGESGFLALCPFAGVSSWQAQAVVPELPEPSLEAFRRIFTDVAGLPGVELANPSWLSTYRVNVRMAEHTRVGRVFIAGDAAHVHSPAGGLGMNTGIQDAYNLGWKLAAVLAGEGDSLLDTYAEERVPVAAWTLGTSSERLQRIADGFAKGENRFADADGTDVRQLGIGYRWSGLSREFTDRDGRLRAGDRAPDAPCLDRNGANVRLFDLFRGPHWTLLGFGAGSTDAIGEAAAIHPGEAFLVGRDVLDPDGHAADAYGVSGDTLVLVRPDGYVAAIGEPGDVRAMLDQPGWRHLDPRQRRSIRSAV